MIHAVQVEKNKVACEILEIRAIWIACYSVYYTVSHCVPILWMEGIKAKSIQNRKHEVWFLPTKFFFIDKIFKENWPVQQINCFRIYSLVKLAIRVRSNQMLPRSRVCSGGRHKRMLKSFYAGTWKVSFILEFPKKTSKFLIYKFFANLTQ